MAVSLQCRVWPYRRALTPPLVWRGGEMAMRHGFWLSVEDADVRGWGEVTGWPGFGDSMQTVRAAEGLAGRTLSLPADAGAQEIADRVAELHLAANVAAGLTTALLDWSAQRRGVGLAAYLRGGPVTSPQTAALVHDAKAAQAAMAAGYPAVKTKWVRASGAEDRLAAIVASLAAGQAKLRVDANGGMPPGRVQRWLTARTDWPWDWLEQPLPAADLRALADLAATTSVPIAADEAIACHPFADVLNAGVDVVVLKPSFVGGPVRACTLAQAARRANVRVCVTHAFETAVGRAMVRHVAAAIGDVDPGGLITDRLADDVLLPAPQAGCAPLPPGAGLGVRPAPGVAA